MKRVCALFKGWLPAGIVFLGGCGAAGSANAASPTEARAAPAPHAPIPAGWVWGVSTDNPAIRTEAQVEALRAFARRVTVRTVFDLESTPADYRSAVRAISAVADVMAQPLDSSDMAKVSLTAVRARIDEYLRALGDSVQIWEIGNEINGEWLGADATSKSEAMFDAVAGAGKRTALTLYYERAPTPGFDMIPWVDAHIPPGHRMRTGLDYVFVSYYEDQNDGHALNQPELDALFGALSRRFPNAKVGFGEFGWGGARSRIPRSAAQRAQLISRFYNYRVPSMSNYVGGGFYWHFRQTMTPKTRPDWGVLDLLMRAN